MKRREFLAGLGATLSLSAQGVPSAHAATAIGAADGLGKRAAASGFLYGCATRTRPLEEEADYREALVREAAILVHENDLKRKIVQPAPNAWNFGPADVTFRFAEQHGMKVRGHTLVWYKVQPDWLEQALAAAPDERLMTDYISFVCRRYRGRVHAWDVVNEAIEPKHGHVEGLRLNSAWYKAFGEGYIATAFHAAREADPSALLFACDFSTEMASEVNVKRRAGILRMLEKLKAKNVPIDAFGVHGHLKPFSDTFAEKAYARFLDDVASLGLKIMVTELDVADIRGPADVVKRDAEVAAVTRAFLDVSLSNKAMLGVLDWGITDKYSWLSVSKEYKWPDGQLSRGLPLDENYVRKPMWQALADAFAAHRRT